MVYNLQYLIVAAMSGNDVSSVPLRKKMKDAIGIVEALESAKIYYAETITSSAAAAANLM